MNISPLLDATAGTVVALLGIWAALGRGHRMVRWLVVTLLLLAPLLIPAYELVFHHSLAVILIIAGVWLYQGRRPVKWRFSLATALLVAVPVALFGAVLVNAPRFELSQWLGFLGIAVAIASIGLLSLWTVFSERHWWLRTRVFSYCGFFLAVGGHAIYATYYSFQWIRGGWSWGESVAHCYSLEWLVWWCKYYVIGAALAAAFLIALLLLARGTRWFVPKQPATKAVNPKAVSVSRIAFIAISLVIMVLPAGVFYQLLTPTPVPDVTLPVPNGWDDFVSAAKLISEDSAGLLLRYDRLSDPELRQELDAVAPALELMRQGLGKSCRYVSAYSPEYDEDAESVFNLFTAVMANAELSRRAGPPETQLDANLEVLRLQQKAFRGGTISDESLSALFTWNVTLNLWNCRNDLSKDQCIRLAHDLRQIENDRETWDVLSQRQRIVDQHSNWQEHFKWIVWELNSVYSYHSEMYDYWLRRTKLRLMIAYFATQAFSLERGMPPESLEDLVPDYLPAIPGDPYGDAPIRYLVDGPSFIVYSLGPDQTDDSGRPMEDKNTEGGDLTLENFFPSSSKPVRSTGEEDGVGEEGSGDEL